MTLRNADQEGWPVPKAPADSTSFALEWEDEDGRNDPAQRYALYVLCPCETCEGTGKTHEGRRVPEGPMNFGPHRCTSCRGEGKVKQLLATAQDEAAVGVMLCTLAREGELAECPIGLLDRGPDVEKGKRWLVNPWLPSARNVSDAGRTLAKSKRTSS